MSEALAREANSIFVDVQRGPNSTAAKIGGATESKKFSTRACPASVEDAGEGKFSGNPLRLRFEFGDSAVQLCKIVLREDPRGIQSAVLGFKAENSAVWPVPSIDIVEAGTVGAIGAVVVEPGSEARSSAVELTVDDEAIGRQAHRKPSLSQC
ncbi:protein of unknown function [Taphrina deformans PYCC 5710]|uniref:Uncharacterized protein n=1 Tax=Taphrina deformans (strain PYCC 5710 / ATCC 11124 / CBS 356.35 / IMI 108563 / JCM 9778 / NBRC 8474) TaxID=1097556 RepID=R4XF87_TAPDE|nr:protein of unknown function [Taphrina deformans PYCC 5710]|eukprot:CCG82022.1 protein of unknown function [Taphrina deformans PYCC 5710]